MTRDAPTTSNVVLLTALVLGPALLAGVAHAAEAPVVQAPRWFGMDALRGATDGLLFAANADQAANMASTTKAMTVHLAAKHVRLGNVHETDVVTISAHAAARPCTCLMHDFFAQVQAGEQFRLGDLMRLTLVVSANDAAVAVAEHVARALGHDRAPHRAFVAMMNAEAAALRLDETRYGNAAGLDWDPFALPNLQSARDLARLWDHAMQDALFRDVAATTSITATTIAGWHDAYTYAGSRAADTVGWEGWKNGQTDGCDFCWIESATRLDRRVIAALTGSPTWGSSRTDARNIMDQGFAKLFEPARLDHRAHTSAGRALAHDLDCRGSDRVVTVQAGENGAVRLSTWWPDPSGRDLEYRHMKTWYPTSTLLRNLQNLPSMSGPSRVVDWDYVEAVARYVNEGGISAVDTVARGPDPAPRGVSLRLPESVWPDVAVAALADQRAVTAHAYLGDVRLLVWEIDVAGQPYVTAEAVVGEGVEVALAAVSSTRVALVTRGEDGLIRLTAWHVEAGPALVRDDVFTVTHAGLPGLDLVTGAATFTAFDNVVFAATRAGSGQLAVRAFSIDGTTGAIEQEGAAYINGVDRYANLAVLRAAASGGGSFVDEQRVAVAYRGGGESRVAFLRADAKLGFTVHPPTATRGHALTASPVAIGDSGAVIVAADGNGDLTHHVWEYRYDLNNAGLDQAHLVARADHKGLGAVDVKTCRLAGNNAEVDYVTGFIDDAELLRVTLQEAAPRS